MNNLIEQLIKIYFNEEWWHKEKLNLQESWDYFRVLLAKDKIVVEVKNGKVIAYAEYWLINKDQLKKALKQEPFNILTENISDGNICHINSLWIDDNFRGNGVLKKLKSQLEEKDFDYYSGIEQKYNERKVTRRR